MRDYRGFSYKPNYGYTLVRDGRKIHESKHVAGAVCFSEVFYHLRKHKEEELTGTYTLKCNKEFQMYSGNFCPLNRKEINIIVRYIRRTLRVGVHIKEDKDSFIFTFTVVGRPLKHMFLLTFSRVFFEYPYCEFAKEVFRLRESGINNTSVTHRNFLELFHLIHMSVKNWGSGHSLFIGLCLDLSPEILHKAYESDSTTVQNVYGGDWHLADKCKAVSSKDYADWDENYDKRLEKYSVNFEIIKKLKKKNEKDIRRRKPAGVQ